MEAGETGKCDPVPVEGRNRQDDLARQIAAGQAICGFRDFMKRGFQTACEGARIFGWRDLSGSPLEKSDTERLFERLDLMADGGLRDVELLRGRFKAFEPGRGLEGAKLIHVRKPIAHPSLA